MFALPPTAMAEGRPGSNWWHQATDLRPAQIGANVPGCAMASFTTTRHMRVERRAPLVTKHRFYTMFSPKESYGSAVASLQIIRALPPCVYGFQKLCFDISPMERRSAHLSTIFDGLSLKSRYGVVKPGRWQRLEAIQFL